YFNNYEIEKVDTDHEEFVKAEKDAKDRLNKLLSIQGNRTVDDFHKSLGKIMWDNVGMSRNEERLKKAVSEIQKLRKEFWQDVKIPGSAEGINGELEKATRVADFLELGELMAKDALERKESCGGHFREESQTPENEALRDDEKFGHAAVWEYKGEKEEPARHQEELSFENVPLTQRSYK
ncbi:MAG: fumarate reductase/succinate dehydrogenase flavoprotein subunit, partial [Bacteriovoracaceae bacterium]